MSLALKEVGADEAPTIHPIRFIPGCNTPADVTCSQLKVNVERDLPWLDQEKLKDKPLVIVAGGPSLKECWQHIPSHNGDILALNNAYSFLMENKIEPDYFMLLDARYDNIEFLRTLSRKTKHFIAAQAHPAIFDHLKEYNTCLYLTILPETLELTSHIDKPKLRIAGSVGTVGIKALCLAYALGYRELHLYGYDSSYQEEEHHAFRQVLNDTSKKIDIYLDGKKYITTPTFAHQASEFCAMAQGMVRIGFDINLHCSGLLPDLVAYSNAAGEVPIELREKKKYEDIWANDKYRKHAPGEGFTRQAFNALGMKTGDSLIDFGCGSGRGAMKFKEMGLNVTGIDFASNCLDKDVGISFVESCLWNLPDVKADWGYCTDVMEHIPTEKVLDVLKGISERCNGAFFNIATRDDVLGNLIGRRLHMTIMEAEGWKDLLSKYWDEVSMIENAEDGEAIFIVKQKESL